MKFFTATVRRSASGIRTDATFSIPAESFSAAIEALDIFISGLESSGLGAVEVLRCVQASRTIGQKITDGKRLKWEEVKP